MSELDKIRENINSIDEQMAQLFQERMEMSRQVAAFKKDRGLSIRDAERERELIDRYFFIYIIPFFIYTIYMKNAPGKPKGFDFSKSHNP